MLLKHVLPAMHYMIGLVLFTPIMKFTHDGNADHFIDISNEKTWQNFNYFIEYYNTALTLNSHNNNYLAYSGHNHILF